ncbi:MAG: DUF420 domain-containing protein [Verrucomicrobiales bacterium]|nr:DUF420 domain-containing protein [Verrucomicrobiales bacterium]
MIAAIDYSVFPPINATLNALSTVLLVTGVLLIKSGRKEAHKRVMLGALVSSAVFLVCYLFYHYGVGHTTFPEEYPTARKVYLAILVPHIILAVVNVPLIILLVIAALRGRFETHKKLARFTFPSWLFVSVTGVVIYFFIYHWFPPSPEAANSSAASTVSAKEIKPGVRIIKPVDTVGDLVFKPIFQAIEAEAGQKIVESTFTVRNKGENPVEITKLSSTCECLSVTIDANPIPPGETATVLGVFDTEKLHGKSERNITVVTEQRERPVLLTTRIETKEIYKIDNPMTNWEVGEKAGAKVVEFRVLRDKPIRILSVESKRKEMQCELIVVEEGRAYDIKLTPESTENSLLGIARIETDCEIEQYARPLVYFAIQ